MRSPATANSYPLLVFLLPALACCIAVLRPSLATGWFGDDAGLSNRPVAIALADAEWLASIGRLTPFHTFETYVVFDFFRDRIAYKAVLILLTLADLVAFAFLVVRFSGKRFAAPAALCFVATMQIRGYHDPYLAYNGSTQLVAILLIASLLEHDRAIEGGRRLPLLIAVVLLIVCCLSYEVAYLFAPLYLLLARARLAPRDEIRATLPFFVVDLVFIPASLILRTRTHIAAENAYALGHSPSAILNALLGQVTAPLPVSYEIFDPARMFSPIYVAVVQLDQHPDHVFERDTNGRWSSRRLTRSDVHR